MDLSLLYPTLHSKQKGISQSLFLTQESQFLIKSEHGWQELNILLYKNPSKHSVQIGYPYYNEQNLQLGISLHSLQVAPAFLY